MQKLILSLIAGAAIAGCALPQAPSAAGQARMAEIRQGKIFRIDPVQIQTSDQLGVGAVIGNKAGVLLGQHAAAGHSRDVARVANTLLGAAAEDPVSQLSQMQVGQHLFIYLDVGVIVGITQPVDASLKNGEAVRIEGSGSLARVVRR